MDVMLAVDMVKLAERDQFPETMGDACLRASSPEIGGRLVDPMVALRAE